MIPVMRPLMPRFSEVAPWLEQMDSARLYTNFGPLVRELEVQHARRLNVDPECLVSVANATLGLVGAVVTSDASRWSVPDFTFPATAHAVLQAGRSLELTDVHPDTWQLDLAMASGHAQGEELGIMPVLPFGAPVVLDHWKQFRHVIVDAAASLGSDRIDLSNLPDTWAVVFSLHATKTLPAGEGGLAVFGSPERARQFRAWTNFGFSGTRLSSVQATNAKMSEIAAAYGLASLAGWTQERADWEECLLPANAIATRLGVACPVQGYSGVHPYWIVQCRTADERSRAITALEEAAIETRLWWPVPLHEMPAFARHQPAVETVAAKHLAETVLGLPMYRGLTPGDITRVGEVLERVLTG